MNIKLRRNRWVDSIANLFSRNVIVTFVLRFRLTVYINARSYLLCNHEDTLWFSIMSRYDFNITYHGIIMSSVLMQMTDNGRDKSSE